MNDLNQLLLKVANKDQAAFAQLYQESAPKLLSLILNLVNQDHARAEDILQDAFIKIWNKADKYQSSKGSAISWMITVVRNQSFDYFRSVKSRPELVEEGDFEGIEYAAQHSNPDTLSIQAEQMAIFKSLLENLPELQQQAITQSLIYGYSHTEIADKLEVPLGTVKAWIRRNLTHFQKHLSRQACLNLSENSELLEA